MNMKHSTRKKKVTVSGVSFDILLQIWAVGSHLISKVEPLKVESVVLSYYMCISFQETLERSLLVFKLKNRSEKRF